MEVVGVRRCLIKMLEKGKTLREAEEECGVPSMGVYWDSDKNALFIGDVAREPNEEDFGFWLWWTPRGFVVRETGTGNVRLYRPSEWREFDEFIDEFRRLFEEVREEAISEYED